MSTNKSFSSETSERYARALFEVGNDSGELNKIESDIKNFEEILKNNKDIKNFINNPTYSIETQNKAILLLSKNLNFSKNLKNFFLLLVKKRRIFFILKIINSFQKLCLKKRGEIKASIVSSKSLTEYEIKKISEELSETFGSKIKFDYKLDQELIGGFKIQLGSFMIDTSIKNKLKKYEQKMLEN